MPGNPDSMERMAKEIKESLDRISNDGNISRNNNTIRFDAGAIGVWLCVTCCLVILVAVLCGGMAAYAFMGDVKQDIRALQDGEKAVRAYINTGLIKPKEKKDER